MATRLTELIGEQLLQHQEGDEKSVEVSTKQLNGKIVALYFSAHWCSPCREFTPKLAQIYKDLDGEINDKFEIVFVSHDSEQAEFDEYFKEMPWKAIPFQDRIRSKTLMEKFEVKGIPTLVVLSLSGEIITSVGVEEIHAEPNHAVRQWLQGKSIFWSRQAQPDEAQWDDVHCSQCYMRPLLGIRRGCTHDQCSLDLCEKCVSTTKHEHPLIEYLNPKRQYSMKELFASVPYLLGPNKDEQIETKTLWESGAKSIGFYFSDQNYSPCSDFTPKLAKAYQDAQSTSQPFHIVGVSCDGDQESFDEYRSQMPWLSIPFDSSVLFKTYFQLNGIPKLIIMSIDGKVLTRGGYYDISRKGFEAIQSWSRGEKMAPPSPDEYAWSDIYCDGCKMHPLIGQRYRCLTCGNYDLCFACQQKGHEHPLELTPQPNNVD